MERAVEASTNLRAQPAWAWQVLADDPGAVFGDDSAGGGPGRWFRLEMAVPMGNGASLREMVAVEVGPALSLNGGGSDAALRLPLRWRPIAMDPMLPALDGELEGVPHHTGTKLWLRGRYTVRLGPRGRFGDGVAGRRLAHRCLVAFVEGLGRRLDAEVDRRTASASPRPDPHPVTIREYDPR